MTQPADTIPGTAPPPVKRPRRKHTAAKLLRTLRGKKNILITTHLYPDPDALGSCLATAALLKHHMKESAVSISVKGTITAGVNAPFIRLSRIESIPFDETKLAEFDAIVLLDVQPSFPYSPLPSSMPPTAVIDHHRARGRKPSVPFCDIRTDVGACTSIVASYLMETATPVDRSLAAAMLYAIESDLAGAAGFPDELDTLAISWLLLKADPKLLYQMRNSPLPREHYAAFHKAIGDASLVGKVLLSHLGKVETPEMPALAADFLLRFDQAEWVLVSAVQNDRLLLSMRTSSPRGSAGEVMRKLIRQLGEGGGHRTKAGGFIPLQSSDPAEIESARRKLRRRIGKTFEIPPDARTQKLITG